jgi:hypothetical protein
MRNMSFSLTTRQYRNRTKSVTRRLGWKNLKPGDVVMGCVKSMGLKKGQKIKKLHAFQCVSNRSERLDEIYKHGPAYGRAETAREGFPEMTAGQLVKMFCRHNKVKPTRKIQRIEMKHLKPCKS